MAVPNIVATECPAVNDPVLAATASHVTTQIDAIPMTLTGIERLPPVREWSFFKAFHSFGRKLTTELQKKIDCFAVAETCPLPFVIETGAADLEQPLLEKDRPIHKSVPLSSF